MPRLSLYALALLAGSLLLPAAPTFAQAPAPGAAQSAAKFEPIPDAVDASTLTVDMVGKPVVITAKIAKFTSPTSPRAPSRISLVEREEFPVELVYWKEVAEALGADTTIPVGATIYAKGKLEKFTPKDGAYTSLQVRLTSLEQFTIDGVPVTYAANKKNLPAATTKPASATTTATTAAAGAWYPPAADGYYTVADFFKLPMLKQKKIAVKGTIAEYQPAWNERAPHTLMLSEGADSLRVVFWEKEQKDLSTTFKPGTVAYVIGTHGEYKGTPQLDAAKLANISVTPFPADALPVVKDPAAATTTASSGKWGRPKDGAAEPAAVAAATPEPTPARPVDGTRVKVRDLGPDFAGGTYRIDGRVRKIIFAEQNKVLAIHDGTGVIRVILPPGVEPPVGLDSDVTVTGIISFNKARSEPEMTVFSPSAIEPRRL